MVVDFVMRKAPEYKLAVRTMKGKWPGDKALREEFEMVSSWAKENGIKTGKWVFTEIGDYDTSQDKMKFEAGIEIRSKGPVRGRKGLSIKTVPSTMVASVTFNPDQVSPRVVYHGLSDFLRWREKDGEYKESGPYREIYDGNPWTSKRAWSHTQVQAPVRKLKA